MSTDESEKLRKRKGQEADEKPAKLKSCGPGDDLDPIVHADATEKSLENPVLEKKLEEPLLGTSEGRQLPGQCSGTSIPEGNPEEDVNVQSQPEGTIKAQPGQCLYMCPIFLFLWLLISCIYLSAFEHNQSECVQNTIHLYGICKAKYVFSDTENFLGFAGFGLDLSKDILAEKAPAERETMSEELSKQRAECEHNTEKHGHLGSALFQVSIVPNI